MKPLVHYVGKAVPTEDCAWLIPLDHPTEALNDTTVRTSRVLHWRNFGVIETLNTLYSPVKIPEMPWQAVGSDKLPRDKERNNVAF